MRMTRLFRERKDIRATFRLVPAMVDGDATVREADWRTALMVSWKTRDILGRGAVVLRIWGVSEATEVVEW